MSHAFRGNADVKSKKGKVETKECTATEEVIMQLYAGVFNYVNK